MANEIRAYTRAELWEAIEGYVKACIAYERAGGACKTGNGELFAARCDWRVKVRVMLTYIFDDHGED